MRNRYISVLILALSCLRVGAADEVIYDNTRTILGGYSSELREHGDQVDLQGTARTLTSLTFHYFGDFVSDGDEGMQVRLYSNETPYDFYRQMPTRLLYESGTMPMRSGYNVRTIENLNVKLPLDSVTFTIQFKGLATNEVAGLLLYNPPGVGSSFNEFWRRTSSGQWEVFLYSTTDAQRKANGGLKLVARPEGALSGAQAQTNLAIPLRTPTEHQALAQVFRAEHSGKLERVTLALDTNAAPVVVSVWNTVGGRPGSDLLARQPVEVSPAGAVDANFYSQAVYLNAGELYAISVELAEPAGDSVVSLLGATGDPYGAGGLWVSSAPANPDWAPAFHSQIDAAFSVAIVPSKPPVRIASPRMGATLAHGTRVPITIATNLPSISSIWRVRFFEDNRELQQVFSPPYQVEWHATNSGTRTLRVVIEDTFGRPFRSETLSVSVGEAPPVPGERIAHIVSVSDQGVLLRFQTKTNESIVVQSSSDLLAWEPASAELTGTGGQVDFLHDGSSSGPNRPEANPYLFYRVVFRTPE